MGKGGRCVGLTTLPPSCADCYKIWEPQPPGTLGACLWITLPFKEEFRNSYSSLLHIEYGLTFKNRASHIEDGRTATLQMLHYIYTFSTNISTEYFKHAAHSPFFSSKCRLFHNATFFGACIIHILHTGCAEIQM